MLINPGGYLVEAIRKDYAAPRGFVSKAEQEQRIAAQEEQRRKVEDAKRRAEVEQQAKFNADQARIEAHWDSLSKEEQEELTREAMNHPDLQFFVKQYRHAGKDKKLADRYLKMTLDSYILKKLDGTLEPRQRVAL